MGRDDDHPDSDHMPLHRLLHRSYQATGRRLHVLVWVLGVLVAVAIAGLFLPVNRYLMAHQIGPVYVTLMVTGAGFSIGAILLGVARVLREIPRILEARNHNLAIQLGGPHSPHGGPTLPQAGAAGSQPGRLPVEV